MAILARNNVLGGDGFLLPDEIDPGENICVAVNIPNDPLYIAAFIGMYERMGTWVMWEKDGTTRARDAAQVWKNAIDASYVDGQLERCMSCCDDLITAINNIKINVTCGGCGVPEKTFRLPSDWMDDWATEPTAPSSENTELSAGDLCDRAFSAWNEMRVWITAFADNVADISPYDELYNILANSLLFKPTGEALYLIMATFSAMLYNNLVEDCLYFWDSLKDDFICNVVNSSNSQQLLAWFAPAIRTEPPTFTAGLWLEILFTGTDFNVLYDGTYVPFPEYIGSDCSYCEEQLGVEEIAPGHVMIPVTLAQAVISVNGGSVVNQGGNYWLFSGGANAGAMIEPDLSPWGYDWYANGGTSRQGARIVVGTPTNTLWGLQNSTLVFHGTLQNIVANEDIRVGNAGVLTDWLFEANRTTAISGAGNARMRIIQFGGIAGQSVVCQLWVVMDAGGQV